MAMAIGGIRAPPRLRVLPYTKIFKEPVMTVI
jgi:hypothetical protein